MAAVIGGLLQHVHASMWYGVVASVFDTGILVTAVVQCSWIASLSFFVHALTLPSNQQMLASTLVSYCFSRRGLCSIQLWDDLCMLPGACVSASEDRTRVLACLNLMCVYLIGHALGHVQRWHLMQNKLGL